MKGKAITTSVLILVFAFAAASGNGALSQTGDYDGDLQALERRISMLEKELKSLSTHVTKRAEVTLGYFQEAERTIGDSRSKISSLEQRVSELEKQQAVIEELKSRVDQLETKVLELQRSGMVAEAVRTGSSLLSRRSSSSGQIRRGTAVGELEWRVDRLEAKVMELGTGAKERRASTGLFARKDSTSQGVIRSASIRQTPRVIRVIRADYSYYRYRRQPDLEDTTYVFPVEARPEPEEVRTDVRYCAERHSHRGSSNGRTVAAALGLLGWWVAMLCAHASR